MSKKSKKGILLSGIRELVYIDPMNVPKDSPEYIDADELELFRQNSEKFKSGRGSFKKWNRVKGDL